MALAFTYLKRTFGAIHHHNLSGMSKKGSPLAKSSSIGHAEKVIPSTPSNKLQQPPMPPDMAANPKEQPKPSDHAPSGTLTLSSPVRDEIPPTGGGGGCRDRKFLERCFFCQRSISINRDVFMYSDMRAFCSTQCRQEQMNKEGFMENEDHSTIPDKILNLPGFVHPKQDSNDP